MALRGPVSKSLCDERMAGIKANLNVIETKLDELRTNDIPHIDRKLAILEERSKSKKSLYSIIASLTTAILLLIQMVI